MRGKSKMRVFCMTLGFALLIPFCACATDGQIKLGQPANFPLVIDTPGSYVLTGNLSVTTPGAIGILITSDDVSLDLNGFSVVGDKNGGNDSRGIDARWRKNILIRNGTVRNFYSDGVAVHCLDPDFPARNSIIEDLRVSDNGFAGIVATYAAVRNCVAADNGWFGISVHYGTIIGCEAYRNGSEGDYYRSGINATNSTIVNCTASYNKFIGIYASDSSISECTANNNAAIGIWTGVHGGQYRASSSVFHCTANLNGDRGIRVDSKSRVEGCNIRDNINTGISVFGQYSYVIKNVLSGHTNNLVVEDPSNNFVPQTGDNANMSW